MTQRSSKRQKGINGCDKRQRFGTELRQIMQDHSVFKECVVCTDVRGGKLKLCRSIRSFTSSREIEVNSIQSNMATQATFLHVQSKSPFPNEIQCT